MKPRPNSFWNEEETDTDLITNEMGEDDFNEDDMLGLAHPNLEEHREYREYARLTVWEMPLLSSELPPVLRLVRSIGELTPFFVTSRTRQAL